MSRDTKNILEAMLAFISIVSGLIGLLTFVDFIFIEYFSYDINWFSTIECACLIVMIGFIIKPIYSYKKKKLDNPIATVMKLRTCNHDEHQIVIMGGHNDPYYYKCIKCKSSSADDSLKLDYKRLDRLFNKGKV